MKLYLFTGVILAVVFKLLNDFDMFKVVPSINQYADCKYFKADIKGPEDLAYFNKTTIIVGSGDFRKVFALGTPELDQQGIYAILNAHKLDFAVIKLEIKNFPKKVPLYVHGIYIRKQKDGHYLYAINHAYTHGGERIEVFKFEEDLNLIHIQSVLMNDRYRGSLNDLIVIEDNRFLVTKYMPYADPVEGRSKAQIMDILSTFFIWVTKQHKTYLIDCTYTKDQQEATCKELLDVHGIMFNGITWNNKDIVWIADTLAKGVNEYKITNDGLKFNKFLNMMNAIDNMEYIEETNTLLVGLIPKLYNFFQLDAYIKKNELDRQTNLEYWGTVGSYNLTSNELHILAQNRYLSKGLSGALISGQNLFIGSWCDISVMVCRKV